MFLGLCVDVPYFLCFFLVEAKGNIISLSLFALLGSHFIQEKFTLRYLFGTGRYIWRVQAYFRRFTVFMMNQRIILCFRVND